MLARLASTASALGLSAFGFFGNPSAADPLSPLGIMMLAVSGVVWFGWDAIGASYAYREEVWPNGGLAFLQAERLGPAMVDRLVGKDR